LKGRASPGGTCREDPRLPLVELPRTANRRRRNPAAASSNDVLASKSRADEYPCCHCGLRFPQYPLPQVSTAAIISFVDINSIPTGAIDRIEILNDGGSATYGTDAVAGVVNLILKSDYQGAEIYNYWGESQRGDAETYHGYFVGGLTQKFSDTSKLNVVASIDYYSQGPIMQQDRAFTQLNHSLYSPNYPAFITAFPSYTGHFTDTVTGINYQTVPGTRGPAANLSTNSFPDYNDKWYQLQPRESRLGGAVTLTYDVTDWLKLYDSFIIARNEELSSYQNEGVYASAPGNSGGSPFRKAQAELLPARTTRIILFLIL
jgi:TonB-dependent Receptor Plug Domain